VSLAAADRVRFRYRLDGYDRDWSAETNLRLAFYTHLRPGHYQFRVKAANSHGIWNDQEARLPFVIAPYLWERPVSWVALALLIAIVAGALHRHRLGVLRRLEELKHGEALASERERIAADMHDQLGSALTQITMYGEAAKGQLEDKPRSVHSLDRITQIAREVAADISDLVWAIQPRHDLLEDLAAYAREHAAQQLDGAGIQARLSFPTALPKFHVSATLRRNLLLVVKEALHNIVKHSGATEAALQLDVAAAWLVLRIQDNGRGFEEVTPVTRGNGLRNMRRRVQELDGQFDLQTTPGQGTRIEVRVPLQKV